VGKGKEKKQEDMKSGEYRDASFSNGRNWYEPVRVMDAFPVRVYGQPDTLCNLSLACSRGDAIDATLATSRSAYPRRIA
jgi:hypothetical protein